MVSPKGEAEGPTATLRVWRGGRAWREGEGEQGQRLGRQVSAHLRLPLFAHSWPLPQSRNPTGLCADRVPLWPWGQGQLPLLLEFGSDRVCRAGVPGQWGLEWDGAHLPP